MNEAPSAPAQRGAAGTESKTEALPELLVTFHHLKVTPVLVEEFRMALEFTVEKMARLGKKFILVYDLRHLKMAAAAKHAVSGLFKGAKANVFKMQDEFLAAHRDLFCASVAKTRVYLPRNRHLACRIMKRADKTKLVPAEFFAGTACIPVTLADAKRSTWKALHACSENDDSLEDDVAPQ
jgi:hypothetical protein